MDTKETLIIGGTLNPPTKAHEALVQACLDYDPTADVWLLPSGSRPDKPHMLPGDTRLHLAKLMLQHIGSDRVDICTLELDDTENTETHKTASRLFIKYPERNFRFVFGADAYESMPAWQFGAELQEQVPLLLVPRDGQIANLADAPNVAVLPPLPVDIGVSSTVVRETASRGLSVAQYCCQAIAEHIHTHRVYASSAAVA